MTVSCGGEGARREHLTALITSGKLSARLIALLHCRPFDGRLSDLCKETLRRGNAGTTVLCFTLLRTRCYLLSS